MRFLIALLALLPALAFAQGHLPTTNMSHANVMATGVTQARTLAQRAADVINILDYGTPAAGDTALTAACNAVDAQSEIWMPAGVYFFSSTVTACSGKNVVIRGAGSNSTIISASTTAEPIQITQTSILQVVRISGIGFNSTSASATTRAIDIIYPSVTQTDVATVTIDDVAMISTLAPVASPYPNCYLGAVRLNGAWLLHVNHVIYVAPLQSSGLPVAGTSAIELKNSYNTVIDNLNATGPDAAVLQSAYGEYVNMLDPVVVGGNYGIEITNGPNVAKGNETGLSYYVHGGELDVVLAGVYLNGAAAAWIYGNHITLGRAAGGSGVLLNAMTGANVFGNNIAQLGTNVTPTAVSITGASGGVTVNGNLFDTQTDVAIGSDANANYVFGNSDYSGLPGFPSPVYTDAGTNDTISWPGPNGSTKSLNSQTLGATRLLGTVGAAGQASIAFTGFSSAWSELEIHCNYMQSSVGAANFYAQFGTGSGPTCSSTGYENAALYNTTLSSTPTGYAATADLGAGLLGATRQSGAGADLYFVGKLESPGSGVGHVFMWQTGGLNGAGTAYVNGSGTTAWTGGTAPITGIRVLFSSGTIATGSCSLYGVLN